MKILKHKIFSKKAFKIVVFFVFVFLTGSYFGIFINRKYNIISVKNFLSDKARVNNYWRSFRSKPEFLDLIIDEKDLLKIYKNKEKAIQDGVLSEKLKKYFKAKCIYKNDTFSIKLKMKGDFGDHWSGAKTSFRVKMKGNKLLNGMSSFSIQDPKTRNYIYESVFQRFFNEDNFLHLNYFFLLVKINGENKGVYALEEFFNIELLSKCNKLKAPIIKISEDNLYVDDNCTHCKTFDELSNELYLKNNIECYSKKTILSDLNQRKLFKEARNLLNKFREGELPTSKVFDTKVLSKIYAISDLLGGPHALFWNNSRFYYNPKTKLLEMIPFDSNSGKSNPQNPYTSFDIFYHPNHNKLFNKQVFSDSIFVASYFSALQEVSQISFLEDYLHTNKDDLNKQIDILCIDDYDFDYNYYDKILKRQIKLRKFIHEPNPLLVRINHSNQLEIANKSTKPILIKTIKNHNNEEILKAPFLLDCKNHFQTVKFQNLNNVIDFEKHQKIKLSYNIVGLNFFFQTEFELNEI
ncbi:CotH kinase family protein [Flavobacteriales bacterium]|nr:CotH kinase family protein [Flavobacteriales bacterium]